MTDNNDSPLDRLKRMSKDYLNNIGQSKDPSPGVLSEAEKIKQERRAAREALVKQINPDALKSTGFDESYASLQDLRKQTTDQTKLNDTASQETSAIKLGLTGLLDAMNVVGKKVVDEVKSLSNAAASTQTSLKKDAPTLQPEIQPSSSSEKKVEQSAEKSAVSANTADVSEEILTRMSVLATKMTGHAPEIHSATSLGKLDKLSAHVRTAWVSVLSQGAAAQSSGHHWLNDWEKIVKDIGSSAETWPAQHQQTWKQWSTATLEEIEHLRPWFSVATQSEVQIDTVLMVPSSYKNKGIIPSVPKNVPKEMVLHLQACADYYEFISEKTGNFFWANTPAKHAFEEGRKRLENWNPVNEAQGKWKEKSLNRYSILEGRLTLKSVKKAQTPVAKKMVP